MTIDSGWLHCFKEDVPEAFTEKPQFRPTCAYSDGQIKLMQSPPDRPMTWDDYVYNRFVRHYLYYLEHLDTLIIAFDNYEQVPPAKCMTQTSRRKHIPPIPFSETSPLPCMVPEGEYWTQTISNRTFKTKVIELVSLRLPKLLLDKCENPSSKTIIIDYHQPVMYRLNPSKNMVEGITISDMPALGEADVKFPRWAERYPKILIDSIDGDTIPIALLQHELLLQQEKCPPKVTVYRMKINLKGSKPTATTEKTKPVKRKGTSQTDLTTTEEGTTKTPKRPPREYEYCDIHMLYQGLLQSISQSLGPIRSPSHSGHEMRMVTTLILLTGSDFTRQLPQLGACTLWENLPHIWLPLTLAYQPASSQLQIPLAMSCLITGLYRLKFEKHLTPTTSTYVQVYRDLMASRLAPRTKNSLAPVLRIETTLKNCNWVLQYWACQYLQVPPSPISEQFGYKMLPGGKTQYMDV